MGYAGGPSVRRRCAEATAPQIAKSIGRRIYLAEAALGARSRRRRPFGAAGGGGAAFLSLPGAVWSPPIPSPRPMDSSSRRALARTAHAKPGHTKFQ